MSRDPRIGYARALRDADMTRVRGIRRASLPTQAAHGPSGPAGRCPVTGRHYRAWLDDNGDRVWSADDDWVVIPAEEGA